MTPTQTDTLIYKILTQSRRLDISGGIFTAGERPDDSRAEDIVINNISFEHSRPARGVSNVNIHVPDIEVTINGTPQRKADRDRMQEIADAVISILESTTIDGVKITLSSSQVFAEETGHYFNLRYDWLIAKPHTTDLDISEPNETARLWDVIADLKARIEELEKKGGQS